MRLIRLDGEWQNIQPMQTPRRWFAAVNCNKVVYAISGQYGKKTQIDQKVWKNMILLKINGNM